MVSYQAGKVRGTNLYVESEKRTSLKSISDLFMRYLREVQAQETASNRLRLKCRGTCAFAPITAQML